MGRPPSSPSPGLSLPFPSPFSTSTLRGSSESASLSRRRTTTPNLVLPHLSSSGRRTGRSPCRAPFLSVRYSFRLGSRPFLTIQLPSLPFIRRPAIILPLSLAGTFPWQASAFGNSNDAAPIDYSILQLNWTATPLQCALLNQVRLFLSSLFLFSSPILTPTLPGRYSSPRLPVFVSVSLPSCLFCPLFRHSPFPLSSSSACYYCGPSLRVLCMTVDSERTSLPDATSYLPIVSECAYFLFLSCRFLPSNRLITAFVPLTSLICLPM